MLAALWSSISIRSFAVVGSVVWVLLFINSYTGLEENPGVGVFLNANRLRYGSVSPFAFLRSALVVFTAFFTLPFV